tara:strand:- start:675 stop:1832 length:1158 start_codon:yes stop_codon:yes gene_type:complete
LLLPFFSLQLLYASKLSIFGLLLLIKECGEKYLYKFIFTISICLIPLINVLLKGFNLNFYNASIELVFFSCYVFGFVASDKLILLFKEFIFLINKRKYTYNLLMILGISLYYFSPVKFKLFNYIYILLITVEVTKTFLLYKKFIKRESIYKFIDLVPFTFIIFDILFNSMENTSSVIFVSCYLISIFILLAHEFVLKIIKLKLNKFFLTVIITLIIILFLSIIAFNLDELFYKYSYFIESVKLLTDANLGDLKDLANFWLSQTHDSVSIRVGEAFLTVVNSPNSYFGSKLNLGSFEAILAHASIATLLFKYGFRTIIFSLLLFINPINKLERDVKENNVILLILPVILMSFNNQGDFLTALIFGISVRFIRDSLSNNIFRGFLKF